jgi:hypothetical protein
MMTHRTIATLALLISLATTQALAQTTPVWHTPADAVSVLTTGTVNNLTYAMVRDSSLRGHNTFAITVGAHIGKLTVIAIDDHGVLLSNGRVLPNMAASEVATTDLASGHH